MGGAMELEGAGSRSGDGNAHDEGTRPGAEKATHGCPKDVNVRPGRQVAAMGRTISLTPCEEAMDQAARRGWS